jgi:hypothetical protein
MKHLFLLLALAGLIIACSENDIPSEACDSTIELTLETRQDPSTCDGANGLIDVAASGGTAPYTYSLSATAENESGLFNGLTSGSYTINVVDARNCTAEISVQLNSTSTLSLFGLTDSDTDCVGGNGLINVSAESGVPPYQFSLNGSPFGINDSFQNLQHGNYTIAVKDAAGCVVSTSVEVPRGASSVSYANDIQPIFQSRCNSAGCHGGGTGARDWTNFANVQTKAVAIKTRTGNKSMPIGGATLTDAQIALIACWVDDGARNN